MHSSGDGRLREQADQCGGFVCGDRGSRGGSLGGRRCWRRRRRWLGEKAADAANAGGKAAEPAVAKEASLETAPLDLEEMFNRCMRNVKLAVTTLEKFSLRICSGRGFVQEGCHGQGCGWGDEGWHIILHRPRRTFRRFR